MQSTRRRISTLACFAIAALALGFTPVLAQGPSMKTCTHEGKTYKDGDQVTIGGKPMECDGATGTWVPKRK